MGDRLWYARRGVPWAALALPLALLLPVTLALHLRPALGAAFAPLALALVAAAAAYLYDESALAIARVTPRGDRWRGGTRLALLGLPLAAWVVVAATLPGQEGVPVARGGWALAGIGACLLATGSAAYLSWRGVPAPGSQLAPLLALGLVSPLVVADFLGLPLPYPGATLTTGVALLWAALAAAGLALAAASLRTRPGT